MANYKRKKPRTQVRCTICTPGRDGNAGKVDDEAGAGRRVKGKRGWENQATEELEDEFWGKIESNEPTTHRDC